MTYAMTLHRLARTLTEIADLEDPGEVMVRLGRLTNYTSGTLWVELRAARVDAATRAVAAAGSQLALAERLGISPMAVSRALRPERTEPRS